MMPDGMGADRYRERQNMMEANAADQRPDFNFDVVAVDVDTGEECFVTESTYTKEEAQEARQQAANARGSPPNVRYTIQER